VDLDNTRKLFFFRWCSVYLLIRKYSTCCNWTAWT